MREIKFRAWDGKEIINDWMRAVYVPENDFDGISLPHYYNPSFSMATAVDVMQYTGLKDKNGKEIYEGDIVYAHMNDTTYEVKHGVYDNVKIDDAESPNCYGWYITRDKNHRYNEYFDAESMSLSDKYLEVIGNIYENPELFQGE